MPTPDSIPFESDIPDFKPLGVIGLHKATDGTPCIAIQKDNGELFIQTYKGMGPMCAAVQDRLKRNDILSRLSLESPPESFLGTAYNVHASHERNLLVEENVQHYISIYLRASVAELLASHKEGLDLDMNYGKPMIFRLDGDLT